MKRLLGIHMTPPARAVEPPSRSVFSSTTTDFPDWRMTRAEHIDPPPLPTTTKSKVSSNSAIHTLPPNCIWQFDRQKGMLAAKGKGTHEPGQRRSAAPFLRALGDARCSGHGAMLRRERRLRQC